MVCSCSLNGTRSGRAARRRGPRATPRRVQRWTALEDWQPAIALPSSRRRIGHVGHEQAVERVGEGRWIECGPEHAAPESVAVGERDEDRCDELGVCDAVEAERTGRYPL